MKAQPLSSVGVGERKEGMTLLQPSVLQGLGTTLGTVGQREGQGRLFKLHSCFASSVIQWENEQPPGNQYLDLRLQSKVELNGSLQRRAILEALPWPEHPPYPGCLNKVVIQALIKQLKRQNERQRRETLMGLRVALNSWAAVPNSKVIGKGICNWGKEGQGNWWFQLGLESERRQPNS